MPNRWTAIRRALREPVDLSRKVDLREKVDLSQRICFCDTCGHRVSERAYVEGNGTCEACLQQQKGPKVRKFKGVKASD